MPVVEKIRAYTHFIADITVQAQACLLISRRNTIAIKANNNEGSLSNDQGFGGLSDVLHAHWRVFGQQIKLRYERCLRDAVKEVIGEDWEEGKWNYTELTLMEYAPN